MLLTFNFVMVVYKDTAQKALFDSGSEKTSDTDLNPDDTCNSEDSP